MKLGSVACVLLALIACAYCANPAVGVCKAVLIIDNYARGSQSVQQATNKYNTYWNDVYEFYNTRFNLQLPLANLYVENGSSFSTTTNSGDLLNAFRNAVANNVFPVVADACIYHLVTGRSGTGIGGLAWVNTACGGSGGLNKGYAVDINSGENSELVIRRMIHEIGHNLNGNHPDAYQNQNPAFQCSVADNNGLRILKNEESIDGVEVATSEIEIPSKIEGVDVLAYNYLNPNAYISDCATNAIQSSLSGFECMWINNPTSPTITFFQDINYGGSTKRYDAHKGTGACYNTIGFDNAASSFKAQGTNIVAVWFASDCRGSGIFWNTNEVSWVGPEYNDRIQSFKFS